MIQSKIKENLNSKELIETLQPYIERAKKHSQALTSEIEDLISILEKYEVYSYSVGGGSSINYGKEKYVNIKYRWKHPGDFSQDETVTKKFFIDLERAFAY